MLNRCKDECSYFGFDEIFFWHLSDLSLKFIIFLLVVCVRVCALICICCNCFRSFFVGFSSLFCEKSETSNKMFKLVANERRKIINTLKWQHYITVTVPMFYKTIYKRDGKSILLNAYICCYIFHHHHHHCQLPLPPTQSHFAWHRISHHIHKLQKSWRNIRSGTKMRRDWWFITIHLFYMRAPKNESAAAAAAKFSSFHTLNMTYWRLFENFFERIPLILLIFFILTFLTLFLRWYSFFLQPKNDCS